MTTNENTVEPKSNARLLAEAEEVVRKALGLESLEPGGRPAPGAPPITAGSIKAAVAIAFGAGFAAAGGRPVPARVDFSDPNEVAATLRITRRTGRPVGGTWVRGRIADHTFEALVFALPPENPEFEIPGSRISKFWLRHDDTGREVASFERGWDLRPATDAAKVITDLLAAGLAKMVFGK